MDEFLDNQTRENNHREASYYRGKAKESNKDQLNNVFAIIDAAASSGEFFVHLPLNIQLKESQVEYLKGEKGFGVDWQWDSDDDEQKRWKITF
jgi:hypothetical protein